MARTAVMHVVDALRIGGAERVALNLANLLPQDRYDAYLCTTREEGPLTPLVEPHVKRLALHRKSTLDLKALSALVKFIRANNIKILHAHASALFFTRLASLFPPFPKVIWHDHYGRYAFNDRPVPLYKLATKRMGGVVAVNRPLEDWSVKALGMPRDRVWYIANLVQLETAGKLASALPGTKGKRIVCVANIRPQKDHFNLLQAMRVVKQEMPDAHLLLVGDYADKPYCDSVIQQIRALDLSDHVTYLGARHDIPAILRASDVGVLASRSEGLPLALLEYGMAGLPVVATNVGQCQEVLDDGSAGILVPPAAPQELANAIRSLLASPANRLEMGARLKARVESEYSAPRVIARICDVYDRVLGTTGRSDFAKAKVASSAQ